MKLTELVSEDRIFLNVPASSRDGLFAYLSERAEGMGLVNGRLCTKALHAREELGSTALGKSIAIPHARIKGLEGVVGLLATLARPIDFEAVDGEPVDLVMMLLMPEQPSGDQIKALSRIARIARDETTVKALRNAVSADEVTDLLAALDEGY